MARTGVSEGEKGDPKNLFPNGHAIRRQAKTVKKTALAMPFHHGTQHFNYYVVKGLET